MIPINWNNSIRCAGNWINSLSLRADTKIPGKNDGKEHVEIYRRPDAPCVGYVVGHALFARNIPGRQVDEAGGHVVGCAAFAGTG